MRNRQEGIEANPGILAEEKLKLLEFSIDIIADAVYWVTPDGRFWNVNAAACKMLDYSRQELLSMSVLDIDPTYDPLQAQSDFEKVKRTGTIQLARFHLARDGRVIPVEVTSNYFVFNGIEYICAVARDISERIKAEKEAAFFRTLIEHTSDPVYVSDFRNPIRMSYVNQAACLHFGMDREQVLSMRIPDWDPAFDVERLDRACAELKEKKSVRVETLHRVASGSLVPVEVTANYLEIDGEELIAGYFHDISERKRAENALRENEEMFRVLADTSPSAICVYQGEHQVYVNAAMIRLTGYSDQELKQMSFWGWLHEDYKELVRERGLARQRGETVPSQYEFKCITKCGEVKWIFASAGRIVYRGKPAGIVMMFDISDRKRMEEELQQAHDELEQRVGERTLALRNANEQLQHEINERSRAEKVISTRLRLHHFAATHTLDELLEATLDEAEALTGSLIGFYHFLEADQARLTLQNWSTRTKKHFCKAEGKGLHYDVLSAGVWVDCIRQHRPVIHNDYASLPHRKGLPAGHAPVIREMVVPVLRGKKIVAILGLGNKPLDYTSRDVETVSLLADLAWEIVERKRAEEDLRKANLVVENSPVVLFRWKAADGWPVELISKNVVRFGYLPEEFLSGAVSYSSIIHPDDLERVAGEVRHYSAECVDQFRQEYRIVTRAGKIRWIDDQTFIERNEAGVITHYQGVVIDITDRKQAEEQLRQKQQMLEELNGTLEKRVQEEVTKNREKDMVLIQQNRQAALGEMLDHIAHQWKQPLNSIALIIQVLKQSWSSGDLTDEDVEESVSKTMALLEHMGQTISVFRDFYRPEKERSLFYLIDTIDRALLFMMPALKYHGIRVAMDADPDLSAIGYPNEYAQVLLNILGNARDTFRERKVDQPVLKIEAFAERDKAVVTVTDNAGGIPEAIIGKIFDLYFTTRESQDGTGIGLYMSKNIIEKNMAGKLSVANVAGGAQFRIEIDRSER